MLYSFTPKIAVLDRTLCSETLMESISDCLFLSVTENSDFEVSNDLQLDLVTLGMRDYSSVSQITDIDKYLYQANFYANDIYNNIDRMKSIMKSGINDELRAYRSILNKNANIVAAAKYVQDIIQKDSSSLYVAVAQVLRKHQYNDSNRTDAILDSISDMCSEIINFDNENNFVELASRSLSSHYNSLRRNAKETTVTTEVPDNVDHDVV